MEIAGRPRVVIRALDVALTQPDVLDPGRLGDRVVLGRRDEHGTPDSHK